MKIQVYLKNNVYTINCGNGSQKIRWLIQTAAIKYDQNIMFMTGLPKYAKLQDGTQLNLNQRISQRLQNNHRIFVGFEDFIASNNNDKPNTDKKGNKITGNNNTPLQGNKTAVKK